MTKNKGGRPPKFKSIAELEKKIKKYFKECEEKDKALTKVGLAIALDVSKETLREYKASEGKFSASIKEAHNRIEEHWNQLLQGNNATGPIFYLKSAFKYKDRMDITTNDQNFLPSKEKQDKIDKLLDDE